MSGPLKPAPKRGEIWFVRLHIDPPGKGLRPVVIVSVDARNQHPRADTVLAVPLTTSIHRDVPTHVMLPSGETGLPEDSSARAEDVTVVRKDNLVPARAGLLKISHTRLCQIGRALQAAIGCATSSW
jgi:mRNA interferase MazF